MNPIPTAVYTVASRTANALTPSFVKRGVENAGRYQTQVSEVLLTMTPRIGSAVGAAISGLGAYGTFNLGRHFIASAHHITATMATATRTDLVNQLISGAPTITNPVAIARAMKSSTEASILANTGYGLVGLSMIIGATTIAAFCTQEDEYAIEAQQPKRANMATRVGQFTTSLLVNQAFTGVCERIVGLPVFAGALLSAKTYSIVNAMDAKQTTFTADVVAKTSTLIAGLGTLYLSSFIMPITFTGVVLSGLTVAGLQLADKVSAQVGNYPILSSVVAGTTIATSAYALGTIGILLPIAGQMTVAAPTVAIATAAKMSYDKAVNFAATITQNLTQEQIAKGAAIAVFATTVLGVAAVPGATLGLRVVVVVQGAIYGGQIGSFVAATVTQGEGIAKYVQSTRAFNVLVEAGVTTASVIKELVTMTPENTDD